MVLHSILPVSDRLFYTQPDFGYAGVTHGFFGRNGGVSTDVYATLNCGPGSGDDPGKVKENRKIVAEAMGVSSQNLLSLHQVHGNSCVIVEDPWVQDDKPKADASVTDKPGIGLGVLSADCAPVLFSGQKSDGSPVVGAAHAGWGGALKGVLEATIEQMQSLDAEPESIQATIGPCISQKSYEVSENFAVPFIEEDEVSERFFKAGKREGHLMFDLPGYCAFRLARAGVKTVFIRDLDTYFNEEDFFSYRRSTHRAEKDYGRQISVIAIKA